MPVTSPSLKTRLDYLEAELKQDPPGFILSADLPFAIFRYNPRLDDEQEWLVRREIQNLKVRVQNATGRMVHILSLAELFWKAIEEAEGIDAVVRMERLLGFEEAQRQVGSYLSSADFRPLPDLLVDAIAQYDPKRSFVFLTRVAALGPNAYPVSILMEQLLGRVQAPGVLLYPGTWNGSLNFLGLQSDDSPMGSYRVKIYGAE
jgi:hypothetical protein